MRIYPLTDDVAVIDAPEGHYEALDDGGFDLPGTLFERLHSMGVKGRRHWEDAIDRQHRTAAEEASHRSDPSTLLAAVEELIRTVAGRSAPAPGAAVPAAPDAAREALIALGWTPPGEGDAAKTEDAPPPKTPGKTQAKTAA